MSDQTQEPDLSQLREQIDVVDAQWVSLLGQRFALTRQVGYLKAELGLPAQDEARESHQRLRLAILAEDQGIDATMVLHMYDEVVKHVLEEHEAIRRDQGL